MFLHLGIQEASQKVAPPYKKPGPWDGTVTHKYKGVLDIVSKGKMGKYSKASQVSE